ncbi:DUF4129 domain-containing protein [Marinilabilia salmonicolor]|uniref:DUF4129 domain-containing protein n=1 Tax=Marinilabilia salmonicolor TaxID=989 RepID=UPI00029A2B28|nr:DUF4129 domain-containing protein [Marinilabilia salmonicolor]
MYRFLLLLFICLLGVSDLDALAQTVPDSLAVSRVAVWDEGPVNYRTPPYEQIEQWKADPDYLYDRGEGPNILNYLITRIFYWLGSFVGNRPWFFYVILVLAGLLVLYLLLRILDVPVAGLFVVSRQGTQSNLRFSDDAHDYTTPKLMEMLRMFRNNKAWREAVRMMFLLYLRELDDKGEITIKPFKTNQEYYREISDSKIKEEYRKRKRLFDVVWYGHVDLDSGQFEQVERLFTKNAGKEVSA